MEYFWRQVSIGPWLDNLNFPVGWQKKASMSDFFILFTMEPGSGCLRASF